MKKIFLIQALFWNILLPAGNLQAQGYNNIEFIENKGQWDPQIQYRGDISNGIFFIRKSGFTVVQYNSDDWTKIKQALHDHSPAGFAKTTGSSIIRSHSWNVDFIGASPAMKVIAEKPMPTYNNYFIGNDQSKWASSCGIFQAIVFKDVYPNIDVRYYTDKEYLKYDIIVHPGGDVSAIALKYDGVNLNLKNKELNIITSVGELKESAPFTYQSVVSGRQEIKCRYKLKDNIVRFDVEDYDKSQTLVIDPIIIFGSFCGGTAESFGFTATYGSDGSMFGGGRVYSGSGSFPVSPGAFQSIFQGGQFDIGIIKLNPTGTNRVYATYIGGSGEDQPHSMIADPQGNLVISGRSNSANFPLFNGGLIGTGGAFDMIVLKLNATGTALIGSRKLGGFGDDGVNIDAVNIFTLNSLHRNYGDNGRSEVILDGAGNVFVAAMTQSNNFPVTAGAFQTTFGGKQDGVVIRFNPSLSNLDFASYFGGSENDAAYVLSINPASGQLYVGGGTESGDLPGNKTGSISSSLSGTIDGFVTIFNPNGTAVNKTTYIGTNGIEQVFGIQFDRAGFPYIMGQTTGNWPIINANYGDANGRQFIAKLQPDLSNYVYSTKFGTDSPTPNISPVAFLVDNCENVYISGFGGKFSTAFNPFQSAGTTGLPVTADAFKSTTDGFDFYFFVLKKDAASLLFASFYGENNTTVFDHVDGGTSRFDAQGNIYQAICGNCNPTAAPNPLPGLVTSGSWATTNAAGACNLTMVKIAMQLAGVKANIQSSINGIPRDTAGCVPLTVDFVDTIGAAQSYEWYFNDGSTPNPVITITPNLSHQFNSVGTYQVMLVAIDPTSCNVRDSSYITIKVGNNSADLNFSFQKVGPCESFTYAFTNTSLAPFGPAFNPNTFTWNFGDGSPLVNSSGFSPNPVTHVFPGPGTYNVKLTVNDTRYCDGPDSLIVPVSIGTLVKAAFTATTPGCVPFNAVFKNTTTGGQTWLWEFGDGNISTSFEPAHLYTVPGTYQVRLIAFNPNTCNGADTSAFTTITVSPSPVPAFTFSPDPPMDNTPVTFNNLSSPDATHFKWKFGDGDSLLTASRAPVNHQYNSTGTFNACLTAYNNIDCESTVCKQVKATIVMAVDVPAAFTPNSNDQNSILYVKGYGISKVQFTIWNRWGQKVFETTSLNQGWDGKVKGALQPMDVYAYTLNVEFSDGTRTTKKGDITLIR